MPLTPALSVGVEFLWSYDAATRMLDAAFSGVNPGGWVGWGFSDTLTQDNAMVPGNAIIVKADSSAATGEGAEKSTSKPRDGAPLLQQVG
jgi:hypothetical protein